MSNLFYPLDLRGLTWQGVQKRSFQTLEDDGDGGQNKRVPVYPQNVSTWNLKYSFVKQGRIGPDLAVGVNELMAFHNAMRAGWDSFLFRDPDDHGPVTAQPIAVSDGVTAQYTLTRSVVGSAATGIEPVGVIPSGAVNAPAAITIYPGDSAIVVYGNGTPIAWNGVANLGLKQFGDNIIGFGNGVNGNGQVPTAGTVLTWSGVFYYRVKFAKDMADFAYFMKNHWEAAVVLTAAINS